MPKPKRKSLTGWIKEGFVKMPPLSWKSKRYLKLNLFPQKPCQCQYIKYKKVSITITEIGGERKWVK